MLLAIAVILPTVCLLWFMTQAVKNERLAVRQKLADSYTARAEDLFYKYSDSYWSTVEKNLNLSVFSATVFYDQNDNIIYPLIANKFPKLFQNIVLPDTIHKAWKLEFSEKNYEEAIKQYDILTKISSVGQVKHECQVGIVRCLTKQNKFDEAIKVCLDLAYPSQYIKDKYTPELISQDRLMLVSLYSRSKHKDLLKELQSQFSDSAELFIPSETKMFVLGRLIDITEENGLAEKLKTEIQNAQRIIDSSQISLMAADYLDKHSGLKPFPQNVFRKLESKQPLYGIYFKRGDKEPITRIIGLLTPEKMSQFWQKSVDDFTDKLVFCRIYDDKGLQIAGDRTVEGELFSMLNLKNHFTGWKAELYLQAGVFKEAANRQMLIYIWVAVIVIGLMLISSLLAGRAVLRQARLNKLKNDFIATITHELKTPLASMRVLVDTLLEGNYKDQQQVAEYLQMTSKENERLTRLIDNFLTFSRMERNKQVFAITETSPAAIARSAVEVVRNKFSGKGCRFDVVIDEDLPNVSADHDSIVTVIVNLLDNAYKYSYEDKHIELKVFAEEGSVYFVVSDNGIGIPRRFIKKIFGRFYQVDRSLSRRAEGCGLGLSIVKFIVDAHRGSITAESKPGKGSTFTVRLPVSGQAGAREQGSHK